MALVNYLQVIIMSSNNRFISKKPVCIFVVPYFCLHEVTIPRSLLSKTLILKR